MRFSCVTHSMKNDALNVRLSFFSVVQSFVTCTKAFPVRQTLVRAVSFEKAIMNRYGGVNLIYLFIEFCWSVYSCSLSLYYTKYTHALRIYWYL